MPDNAYKDYLVEYSHGDSLWMLTIPAESFEDAEARLKRLVYARVLGEVVMKVPARYGFLVRAWCWLKNL